MGDCPVCGDGCNSCGRHTCRNKMSLSFRVTLKAVAGETNSKLYLTRPELLLDTPHSMGCYHVSESIDSHKNMSIVSVSSILTPASCVLACHKGNSENRFAGN